MADAAALAAEVRASIPSGASVAREVREIITAVRAGGDAAVLDLERRFGGGEEPLRVGPDELSAALAELDADVRAGLEVAIENVQAVAEAGVDREAEVTLRQGHTVRLREIPATRAAIFQSAGTADSSRVPRGACRTGIGISMS